MSDGLSWAAISARRLQRQGGAARRGALEAQVERVGQILEAEPTMTIGTVVGPHA